MTSPTNCPDETPKKKKLSRVALVFFAIAALALVIDLIGLWCAPFADAFNRTVASFFRRILAYTTNLLPFSLAEILLILSPVALVFLIVFAIRRFSSSWHDVGIYLLSLLSVLSLFFSLFVFTFGLGYYTTDYEEKLGLSQKDVSAAQLAATAEILIDEVNRVLPEITFEKRTYEDMDFAVAPMPYSLREMDEKLLDAYRKIHDEYPFLPVMTSYVKPVLLSVPMTYTNITGVYSYFTGEANVNTNVPDYTLPFTAAHELAHQRGIAREDEANFTAFLVCRASDDPYIRYSGYLGLLEYVLNALYSADDELYGKILPKLGTNARQESAASYYFYRQFENGTVADISNAINDTYLKIHHTEGTKSYGLVVDLAVAYYQKAEE